MCYVRTKSSKEKSTYHVVYVKKTKLSAFHKIIFVFYIDYKNIGFSQKLYKHTWIMEKYVQKFWSILFGDLKFDFFW
jgi:hypothetical protein